jgi:Protein of unknown function (DUF4446)
MSPAANTALALVALVLALGAIVLATIANRRWASRPGRAGAPDRGGADAAGRAVTDDERGPSPAAADRAARQALAEVLAAVREQVDGLGVRVEGLAEGSATVRAEVEAVRSQVADLAARADDAGDPTALRHVALVRYDAFADVGGRLSYSVALLDDTGSGLVLTTLAGKADVRTYVRTISAGTPDGSLTAEEQQAIDAAVGSRQ